MTPTSRYDFFWKPESNRQHPSTLPSKDTYAELPLGLDPWQAQQAARDLGVAIPLGTGRTGVHEVQCDEGVWTRQGSNRRARSTWVLATWAELEAAEA